MNAMGIQSCSHRGATLQFQASQIGSSGPCYRCNQVVTITGSAQPPPPAAYAAPKPYDVAPTEIQSHFMQRVEREARAAQMQVDGVRLLQVAAPSGDNTGAFIKAAFMMSSTFRIDRVQAFRIRAHDGCIFLIAPWSDTTVMAHEFATILPGTLPTNLLLKRSILGGNFFGTNGGEGDPLARVASQRDLGEDVEWDNRMGKLVFKLQWGLQSTACTESHTLHVMQTAQRGIFTSELGFGWYQKRRHAFWGFLAQHQGPAAPATFAFPPDARHFIDDMVQTLA